MTDARTPLAVSRDLRLNIHMCSGGPLSVLGIDIGGTTTTVSVTSALDSTPPELVAKRSFSTSTLDGRSGNDPLSVLAEHAQALMHAADPAPLRCAVSCGGPLDSAAGVILSPPNLPGWDRVPIAAELERRLRIPATLMNDADAGVLAEWWFGAARGVHSAVFLTFGSGFGAGIVANGTLVTGSGEAGEIGHVRLERHGPVGFGKAGSVEGFCSGGGIAQTAQSLAREQLQRGRPCAYCASLDSLAEVTAEDAAEAAREGDPVAARVFQIAGESLGRTLALLVDLLAPQRIVLGAIYGRAGDLLEPALSATLEAEAIPRLLSRCAVVGAQLSDQIRYIAPYAVARWAATAAREDHDY